LLGASASEWVLNETDPPHLISPFSPTLFSKVQINSTLLDLLAANFVYFCESVNEAGAQQNKGDGGEEAMV
jgi:hypothetical protein